jgi:hypothetical protein
MEAEAQQERRKEEDKKKLFVSLIAERQKLMEKKQTRANPPRGGRTCPWHEIL